MSLTTQEQSDLFDALLRGASPQIACQNLGIDLFRFCDALCDDDEFRDRLAIVREMQSYNVVAAVYRDALERKTAAQSLWLKMFPVPSWRLPEDDRIARLTPEERQAQQKLYEIGLASLYEQMQAEKAAQATSETMTESAPDSNSQTQLESETEQQAGSNADLADSEVDFWHGSQAAPNGTPESATDGASEHSQVDCLDCTEHLLNRPNFTQRDFECAEYRPKHPDVQRDFEGADPLHSECMPTAVGRGSQAKNSHRPQRRRR